MKQSTKESKGPAKKPALEFLVRWLLGGTLDHYGNELGLKHGRIFASFFERIFDRIKIEPEKLEKLRYFAERGRLIYAIPYRSPLDFLFLNYRLRFSGLPLPEIAYNMNVYRFQPLRKLFRVVLARWIHLWRHHEWPNPFKNKYYLERYREGAGFVVSLEDPASFVQRIVYPMHDSLYHLIKLHKKRGETVVIIPIFPVFEKAPEREEQRVWDIFLGPKGRPGRLRKIVHYLRYYPQAFVEVGDPITIGMFLEREDQKGLTDEEAAFNLRKELWEHATREQRVIRGPAQKPRTQLMEAVLRDPAVLKVMRQESKRKQKPFRVVRKLAASYVNEIAANYSQSTIEFLDKVLDWGWNNLFDGVQVDEAGLGRAREAAKRYPLIYVPSHKSHTDYLILSWVLYNHNMVCPHIVAGVNLNTWPIGGIFRKAGAFFMRRTFRDNPLYGAVFIKYVEVLIREGYNLEFFIEGGRSRTGRLLLPKLGMVKYVNEAFQNGAAADVMFVPISIGYDQILEEGEYLEEMSGVKNPKGNLMELLRNRNLIKKRYGRVYVNFGNPISLKDHLASAPPVPEGEEARQGLAIQSLAEGIIQSINRHQLVTPFSLMAAALLTSPHKAINQSELINALALFYQYLVEVGARFADTLDNFSKAVDDVIGYYEGRKLLEVDRGDGTEEPIYTLNEGDRLSLEMYKNMMLHHFLPMSFVSMSLLSADYGECLESKLAEDYGVLKELFHHDFIYDGRMSDQDLIGRCLKFLVNGRQLTIENATGSRKCIVTPKGREEAVYFAAMLTNFLEAYGIVLNSLPQLGTKQEAEKDFLSRLRRTGQRLFKQGQVIRPESLSQLTFQNALKYARERELITAVPVAEGKPPLLVFNPDKDDLRKQLLTHISRFIRVEKYHYLDK